MAQETNQSQAPLLCTTGCGFYGNPRTSGMCSVCYKEHLSRQNSGGLSPVGAGASGSSTTEPSAMQRLGACLSDAASAADGSSSLTTASLPVTQRMTEMSISQEDKVVSVKSDPTEPVVSQPSASTSAAITPSGDEGSPTEVPKLKKNRCFVCRKKVGLTGFGCRCGSLFCGLHRYSDKHNCPYDYKAEAAAKIRKENPVVVADKIQRI